MENLCSKQAGQAAERERGEDGDKRGWTSQEWREEAASARGQEEGSWDDDPWAGGGDGLWCKQQLKTEYGQWKLSKILQWVSSAAPAALLPVLAFSGLLLAFPFPKAMWPREEVMGHGGEQGMRNGGKSEALRGEKLQVQPLRRKMALQSPKFSPPLPSCPPLKGGWGSPAACIKY